MALRLIRRLPRGGCMKLIYLATFTCGFIVFSSQFKNSQSQAKAIGLPADKDHVLNALPDESKEYELHGGGPQTARGHPLPIIKNEEGDGVDADRVDAPDTPLEKSEHEQDIVPAVPLREITHRADLKSGLHYINNEKYPKLTPSGKFIPQRRIIHLDLKGGAYKVSFATGILIEWEDMFPYTGELSEAVNGNAYSMEDVSPILTFFLLCYILIHSCFFLANNLVFFQVENILKEAKRHHMEIIPLVQTFGHLEWFLKLGKFAHLREDSRFPQVICFPEAEAWQLITDMIDQVAAVHRKFDMPFFHMGADEVFQIGICNASRIELIRQGTHERLILWHISRTAKYIKEKYSTTVLAWHDMFAHVLEFDLTAYGMTDVLQPVLWSYAEDLDMYLPKSTWTSLTQFSRNYQDFEVVEGLIMTGWSRYDHMAVLCELLPVALPAMAMSMETMLIYELINEYWKRRKQLHQYREDDFELNGWLSRVAEKYQLSSQWYINKVMLPMEDHARPLLNLEKDLKLELSKIYFEA
uniref:beta-N-acetylhexosaminidase n=1 Tax=Heterorhabditis bacteriophora TaxID=37862 RepID=A0A1I7X2D0_HETBA